jgi:competence protein ComEC
MPKQLKLIHLVILLILSVFAFSTHSVASQKDDLLKVHFFDIGQGDAIFIESPSGQQVLIDGGPDDKILSKLGDVLPFWDRDLDMVILSHSHFDHYNGLIGVLERYDILNIMEAKKEAEEAGLSVGFSTWKDIVKKEVTNNIEPIAGKTLDLGGGVQLIVMHPLDESVARDKSKNVHDDMVVVMLKYNHFRAMLTGDMEDEIERRLILVGEDIDADVLKIGHHGSKTSSSEGFLSAVSPRVGIIQVGAKNRYGHPAPEVLERLENYDIKYYRNDLNGDVKLISDGENYLISTEK